MSDARPIGELIKPIVLKAVGLARLQEFLDCFNDPADRREWIGDFLRGNVITPDEARLLLEHNKLEEA